MERERIKIFGDSLVLKIREFFSSQMG